MSPNRRGPMFFFHLTISSKFLRFIENMSIAIHNSLPLNDGVIIPLAVSVLVLVMIILATVHVFLLHHISVPLSSSANMSIGKRSLVWPGRILSISIFELFPKNEHILPNVRPVSIPNSWAAPPEPPVVLVWSTIAKAPVAGQFILHRGLKLAYFIFLSTC